MASSYRPPLIASVDAFVRVLLEDAFQETDRASVVVPLQRLEASFVQRDGLRRPPLKRRVRRRLR
jgi:hypothetical protein